MFPKLPLGSEIKFLNDLRALKSVDSPSTLEPTIQDDLSTWGLCKYVSPSQSACMNDSEDLVMVEEETKEDQVEEVITMKLNVSDLGDGVQKEFKNSLISITCHLCRFRIKSVNHLFTHLRETHFKTESIECPLCSNVYADPSPRYKCFHCGDLIINFHSHIEKVHLLEKLYKCPSLSKMSWPTRPRLAEHMTRVHLTKKL